MERNAARVLFCEKEGQYKGCQSMVNEECLGRQLTGLLHLRSDESRVESMSPENESQASKLKSFGNGGHPETLFKYYSMDGIVKTLDTNTFKWELPCDENDPFEALAKGWDEDSIKRAVSAGDAKVVSHMDVLFKSGELQKSISHIVAYVSFSEKPNDILMWSHYAEKHTGVCVEFDVAALGVIAKNLSQVKYAPKIGDERPRIPLGDDQDEKYQENVREFLSTKAKEWEYEKEWRSIVPPMANWIGVQKVGNGKFILVSPIPQDAIKRLIFGWKMPVATRIALAKRVKMSHPSCTFAEINPDRTKFQLSVDDLGIEEVTAINQ